MHRKRERQAARLFLCAGDKLAHAVVAAGWGIASIVLTSEYLHAHPVWEDDPRVRTLPARDLARLSDQPAPEGIVVVAEMPASPPVTALQGPALVLYQLNDPGNLGTLIRTAQWYGYRLYCTSDTVDCYNPKVVRAAMGALFHTPIAYVPDLDALVQAASTRIYAAAMAGLSISSQRPEAARDLLLLGSESHGLPAGLLHYAGIQPVHIPATAHSQAESLNVGVAAGILAQWHRPQ